jgi:serine/threonine protein kinase
MVLTISLNPKAIARISYRIFEALSFMRDMGYVHRGVKPENILLHGDGIPDAFLADFGLARWRHVGVGEMFTRGCGSLLYEAPEIRAGQPYIESVDMWAMSVTLFVMATRKMPFRDHQRQKELFECDVRTGNWNMIELEDQGAPDELKDLIEGCIVVDPADRLTARDAMEHPFFINMHIENRTRVAIEMLEIEDDGQAGQTV